MDPYVIIENLKATIQQLKAELALARGEAVQGDLDENEVLICHKLVDSYISGNDSALFLNDYRKITECFRYLRIKAKEPKEDQNLKRLLDQRDTEISVLVPMLNKLKQESMKRTPFEPKKCDLEPIKSKSPQKQLESPQEQEPIVLKFKEHYDMSLIESQREELRKKYSQAKSLGAEATELKTRIKMLKTTLETTPNDSVHREICELTREYKQKYLDLKEMKIEIEHLQHLHDVAKVKLNTDFKKFANQGWQSPDVKSDIAAFYQAYKKI